MRTTGTRDSSIPSRNVGCATVVQSTARNSPASPFIDAVTDIADVGDQAHDHGFSSLRPNCPPPTTGCGPWPSPVLRRFSWMWRRSRNGHRRGGVSRVADFVNACTRPHLAPDLPLMCERAPLAGRGTRCQFACKGSLLIWRHALWPAALSENVTSGDQVNASRTKITAHPTS